jgi:hypothetical protein
LLGAADTLVERFPTSLWYIKMDLERMTGLVSAAMPADSYERERAAGRQLSLEQAVRMALEGTPGS